MKKKAPTPPKRRPAVQPDANAVRTAKQLTAKQVVFVAEYLVDHNATRAAKAAGYSEPSAYQIGHMLLRHPDYAHVQADIDKRLGARLLQLGLDQGRVIEEFRRLALADITDVLQFGSCLKETIATDCEPMEIANTVAIATSRELPRHVTAAIKSVRQTKEGIAVEMHDKVAPLVKLAQLLGLSFTDKEDPDGDAAAEEEGNPLDAIAELTPEERDTLQGLIEARNARMAQAAAE